MFYKDINKIVAISCVLVFVEGTFLPMFILSTTPLNALTTTTHALQHHPYLSESFVSFSALSHISPHGCLHQQVHTELVFQCVQITTFWGPEH